MQLTIKKLGWIILMIGLSMIVLADQDDEDQKSASEKGRD